MWSCASPAPHGVQQHHPGLWARQIQPYCGRYGVPGRDQGVDAAASPAGRNPLMRQDSIDRRCVVVRPSRARVWVWRRWVGVRMLDAATQSLPQLGRGAIEGGGDA